MRLPLDMASSLIECLAGRSSPTCSSANWLLGDVPVANPILAALDEVIDSNFDNIVDAAVPGSFNLG